MLDSMDTKENNKAEPLPDSKGDIHNTNKASSESISTTEVVADSKTETGADAKEPVPISSNEETRNSNSDVNNSSSDMESQDKQPIPLPDANGSDSNALAGITEPTSEIKVEGQETSSTTDDEASKKPKFPGSMEDSTELESEMETEDGDEDYGESNEEMQSDEEENEESGPDPEIPTNIPQSDTKGNVEINSETGSNAYSKGTNCADMPAWYAYYHNQECPLMANSISRAKTILPSSSRKTLGADKSSASTTEPIHKTEIVRPKKENKKKLTCVNLDKEQLKIGGCLDPTEVAIIKLELPLPVPSRTESEVQNQWTCRPPKPAPRPKKRPQEKPEINPTMRNENLETALALLVDKLDKGLLTRPSMQKCDTKFCDSQPLISISKFEEFSKTSKSNVNSMTTMTSTASAKSVAFKKSKEMDEESVMTTKSRYCRKTGNKELDEYLKEPMGKYLLRKIGALNTDGEVSCKLKDFDEVEHRVKNYLVDLAQEMEKTRAAKQRRGQGNRAFQNHVETHPQVEPEKYNASEDKWAKIRRVLMEKIHPADKNSIASEQKSQVLKSEISGPQMSKAEISKAQMSKSEISKAQMSKPVIVISESEAQMSKPAISKAQMSKAEMSSAEMSKPQISEVHMSTAQMSKTQMSQHDKSSDLNDEETFETGQPLLEIFPMDERDEDLAMDGESKTDCNMIPNSWPSYPEQIHGLMFEGYEDKPQIPSRSKMSMEQGDRKSQDTNGQMLTFHEYKNRRLCEDLQQKGNLSRKEKSLVTTVKFFTMWLIKAREKLQTVKKECGPCAYTSMWAGQYPQYVVDRIRERDGNPDYVPKSSREFYSKIKAMQKDMYDAILGNCHKDQEVTAVAALDPDNDQTASENLDTQVEDPVNELEPGDEEESLETELEPHPMDAEEPVVEQQKILPQKQEQGDNALDSDNNEESSDEQGSPDSGVDNSDSPDSQSNLPIPSKMAINPSIASIANSSKLVVESELAI